MKALQALIRREHIEHRGAFVYAPIVLLVLLIIASAYGTVSRGGSVDMGAEATSALMIYEMIFGVLLAGWWVYLLVALFFYFGDAFSADSRSNAMLFWKSMPQSDTKILWSKMAAGASVFPAGILAALLVSGIVAYFPAATAGAAIPGYGPPALGEAANAYIQVVLIALVHFALGLLWYAPFFAWVGLLSTIFRRWSMPLAILVPIIAAAFERFVLEFAGAPREGYVLAYLRDRLDFSTGIDLETWFVLSPLDASEMIARIVASTDWLQIVGGLAITVVLVTLAGEYRRRYVLT